MVLLFARPVSSTFVNQNPPLRLFAHPSGHQKRGANWYACGDGHCRAAVCWHRCVPGTALCDPALCGRLQPHDASHVTGQLQLLIFAMLAFIFLGDEMVSS